MLDGIRSKRKQKKSTQTDVYSQMRAVLTSESLWFRPRGGVQKFFYTEDSGRYITPLQQLRKREKFHLLDARGRFDSVHFRFLSGVPAQIGSKRESLRALRFARRQAVYASQTVFEALSGASRHLITLPFRALYNMRTGLSPIRAWNLSLVGVTLFGMVAVTMIYRSLGQFAWATEPAAAPVHEGVVRAEERSLAPFDNKDEETSNKSSAKEEKKPRTMAEIATVLADKNKSLTGGKSPFAAKDPEQVAFEKRAREMVKGYPIEKMLPEIFKQDREVAAWLIAMAKQESQWGKRVPLLNGQDCLNYWGFRAKRERMGTGGHTCFDSIEDAVTTVGKRISDLHYKYNRRTPERMIVWKCGYSCAGHSDAGVKAWIRTVGMYRKKLLEG